MIPEGTYEADPVPGSLQFGRAKTGTAQVAVEFKIASGDHAGQRITWIGYFTPSTYKRTVESLQHAGMKGTDVTMVDPLHIAERVQIVIKHEEDQKGHVRARVQWVNGLGGVGFKMANPMSKGELCALDQQMQTWGGFADSEDVPF